MSTNQRSLCPDGEVNGNHTHNVAESLCAIVRHRKCSSSVTMWLRKGPRQLFLREPQESKGTCGAYDGNLPFFICKFSGTNHGGAKLSLPRGSHNLSFHVSNDGIYLRLGLTSSHVPLPFFHRDGCTHDTTSYSVQNTSTLQWVMALKGIQKLYNSLWKRSLWVTLTYILHLDVKYFLNKVVST